MARPYVRTDWQDAPSTATLIDEAKLDNIEEGLTDVDTALTAAEGNVTTLLAHAGNTSNPHGVTAAQVGTKRLWTRNSGSMVPGNDVNQTPNWSAYTDFTIAGAPASATYWIDVSITLRQTNLPASDVMWMAPGFPTAWSPTVPTAYAVPASAIYTKMATGAPSSIITLHTRWAGPVLAGDNGSGDAYFWITAFCRFDSDNTGRAIESAKASWRVEAL